ncbi:MAG: hypothetical protein R3C14_51275 [Caldilineaceae bacterium]
MQSSQSWLLRLAGTGLLLVLILGGVRLFSNRLLSPQTVQENPNPVVVGQEAQAFNPDSPIPTPIVVGTIQPTPTTIPTPTPHPTPTRRPGPTATPYPTQESAKDTVGTISYVVVNPENVSSVKQFAVNAQGEKVEEPVPLPSTIDFAVSKVIPSPNGRYLLLLEPVMPGGIPHIFDTQSQKTWLLLAQYPDLSGIVFAWHPDSQQVLFWSLDVALWLVNVETGDITTLNVVDGPVQGAAISPDGQEVAYIARSDVAYNTLWKVSTAGSDAKPLLHFDGAAYLFGWSPDGKQILYMGGPGMDAKTALDTSAPGPMWLIDPNGQNPRAMAGLLLTGWGYEPVWSPDGQTIAFVGLDEGAAYGCAQKRSDLNSASCRFEGTAIYLSNPVTGEVKRLASGINPAWSPDGSRIAFLSNRSGASEVWIVQLQSSEPQQFTSDGMIKTQLVWESVP